MLQMRCSHSYTINKKMSLVASEHVQSSPTSGVREISRKTVLRMRSQDGETAVAV